MTKRNHDIGDTIKGYPNFDTGQIVDYYFSPVSGDLVYLISIGDDTFLYKAEDIQYD